MTNSKAELLGVDREGSTAKTTARDVTVTVYGASDDLVEVGGAIQDEFGAYSTEGGTLTFSDGTKLQINYGPDGTGCWRIARVAEGTAAYSHTPADGDDTDNYSDRVTLRGDIRSVKFRAKKAPAGLFPQAPSEPVRGVLEGFTRVGPESDAARMDWLEAQGVVSIYFRDGSQFNSGSLSLRAALDLAVDRSRSTPKKDAV